MESMFSKEGRRHAGPVRSHRMAQQLFDVFSQDVHFHVDAASRTLSRQSDVVLGVRNQHDGKISGGHVDDREADAIETNESLFNDVEKQLGRRFQGQPPSISIGTNTLEASHTIDVTLNEMPAQSRGRQDGPFQIDLFARSHQVNVGAFQGLGGYANAKRGVIDGGDRQADAIDGDAVAELGALEHRVCPDGEQQAT